ncbi:putative pentatricopeptide repeat-containing protein At3g11460, mitochondrial [Selaginella moellendorffii]|uniref:putative pentatricopeptide repeat-containing protein At3g11460, mitochondrial n=1 Tax=Selaginella moellendorffii TaxID=88036 RepID=UPI000D1D095F|nr:putative pentatricopeptide repeat-containing protein At3g11460, mitochondrial [Selaginella moellendorffii]|eukprot:XP_024544767.1 putative pentatricopeptide repeat-containing protein At3g11460, mitochondrial [Selaginella moellendorffii]
MVEAHSALHSMPGALLRGVDPWMLGYVSPGLEPLTGMEGIYLAAAKACSRLAESSPKQDAGWWMETGMRVSSGAAAKGFIDSDIKVANAVMEMLAKIGSTVEARRVFDRMAIHSCVSWTVLMLGYVENDEAGLALLCFDRMKMESSCSPDARVFVAALKACSGIASKEEAFEEIGGKAVKLRCLERGMAIHSQAVELGCNEANKFVASSLVDMYSNCGSLLDARMVFDKSFVLFLDDVVLWNAMLHAYVENGEPEMAVRVFDSMQRLKSCAAPNTRTYSTVLKACSSLASEEEGQTLETGGVVKLSSLERGMALHSEVSRRGFQLDSFVASTLVSMYASCGSMVDARRVFDRLLNRNVFSWTVLVLGYASSGEEASALHCLELMRDEGLVPESPTFVAALKACLSLDATLAVHAEINRYGALVHFDSPLATSIIDVYGRYGEVAKAQQVFDSLPSSRSGKATWTALLAGLSRSGESDRALELFERMLGEGVDPDATTLQCVLSSCSHSGRIQAGRKLFDTMEQKFGIQPCVEHYICVVDLLCRANELQAAVELLRSMPFKPTAVGWTILLAGCEKWKNLEIGRVAFEALLGMDETRDGSSYAYVLMENIYKQRDQT